MIVKQNDKLFYTTRQYYGTSIEIKLNYDCADAEKKDSLEISFMPGKIREIEMPEVKEDKKVFLVMSAVQEVIKAEGRKELTAIIYNRKVNFTNEDCQSEMFGKIFNALMNNFIAENKVNSIIFSSIENILKDALWRGDIDVF